MTRRTLLGIGMSIITVWSAGAQSTATRTPNIDDGWTVEPGTLQFNFVHRFVRSDAPVRKVTSFPSFFLATGLPGGFNGGLVYSTNSTVFAGIPNEYEFRLRRPLARDGAIDATITAAYNASSQSIDGELGLGRSLGPVHFLGVVRAMSSGFDAQRPLIGAGEGVVVHFNQTFSLTGDYFAILNARGDPNLHSVWGAGLAVQIPYTPHSLAIEITNSTTATIEGSSVGTPSG
ncbi:MAG: hypothetical protein ACRELE_03325, partial [Gemmatimonadales bacterium]